ncbi:hypothetical protein Pmi06nite_69030 [Planotetraspora mira]|uniref:Immunity protein 40 domain-containing protein n=1 Tax=Planotetraspora mira TaxID=58121 RepID=A0A8J3TVX5_9ACTN|nr:hypothetical protein Pmi06nite_69030 [Planotetraspora mira]
MAHVRQEALFAVLPTSIQERSADLTDVGSAEYAFPVDCLDQVFHILVQNDFVILGGDLWRKVPEGFEPVFEGWYTDSPGEGAISAWRQFLIAASREPKYFATFVVQ